MMDGSKESPIVYFEQNGSGPHGHVCGKEVVSPSRAVTRWLERQVLIGGVTREERALDERLVDDLR